MLWKTRRRSRGAVAAVGTPDVRASPVHAAHTANDRWMIQEWPLGRDRMTQNFMSEWNVAVAAVGTPDVRASPVHAAHMANDRWMIPVIWKLPCAVKVPQSTGRLSLFSIREEPRRLDLIPVFLA